MADNQGQIINRWANSEFAWVLTLLQFVALIPLRNFLPDLDWTTCVTYMLIPLTFAVYSSTTQTAVRGVRLKDVLWYGLLAFALTTLVAYVLFSRVLDTELSTVAKPAITSLLATQILFVAPTEELAFRYIIPKYIARKFPRSWKWTPAILSSILFALFHYSAYNGSWTSMLLAFVVAMIWALMYSRWGLGATIGSHAAYNLVVAGLWTSIAGGL